MKRALTSGDGRILVILGADQGAAKGTLTCTKDPYRLTCGNAKSVDLRCSKCSSQLPPYVCACVYAHGAHGVSEKLHLLHPPAPLINMGGSA